MSSRRGLTLIEGKRPAELGVLPWPVAVRGLIVFVVVVAALTLRFAGCPVDDSTEAIRRAPVLVVDPNEAPASVLSALPNVGPTLLAKLIEQREIRPFVSTGDLRRRVRGLGPATLARLVPHLRINPSGESFPEDSAQLRPSVAGWPRLAQNPGRSFP
jgi:competence protein ComEA